MLICCLSPRLFYHSRILKPTIFELQQRLCTHLSGRLEALCGARAIPSGSLVSGHYEGPKSRDFSLNPKCPYQNVHEIDVRILLPASLTLDISVSEQLVVECGAQFRSTIMVVPRLGRKLLVQYLYRYESHSQWGPIEWEFTINNDPFFDISAAYSIVFTPEEIEWQRRVRTRIRTLNGSLHGDYNPTKQLQARECIWRCISLIAMKEKKFLDAHDAQLLFSLPHIGVLEPLASEWRSGAWGVLALERPECWVTIQMQSEIARDLIIPPEPDWVTQAALLQTQCRVNAQIIETCTP